MGIAVGAIFGACILVSCGGETGMNPPPPDENDFSCSDSVSITVGAGLNPTISWTPDCTVGRLIVEQGIDEYWGSETAGENSYRSPIVYDVHPPTALELEPAIPLEAGQTYTVSLFTWVSVTPESLLLVGTKSFTP